ncbi:portal protein [Sphingopyxis sp. Geo48]|uniref:portal protein n=1 Tax=Sphingopyxis sp. Geo48 TaxID=545241 RepID=UPI0024B7F321|nr:portal protein [Sphingopyxis sp. Geo48]
MSETLTLRHPKAPSGEKTRREHVEKVAKALAAQRSDAENDWYSIADFSGYGSLPSLSYTAQGTQRPKMRQLIDDHPKLAFRTTESGMYSGLSSPNRPWIEFKFADPEMADYQPARVWLDSFQSVIYSLFDASNFYQVARKNYGSMARFGPGAGIMSEHPLKIAPCLSLPIGSYWLGLDDAFDVDTLMRNCPMTVDQVVKRFVGRPGGKYDWTAVSPTVRTKWDNSDYQHIVHCRQLIEPGANGAWDSVIWDCNDDRKTALLEAKRYSEQPFWAPRWDTTDTGPTNYGRGVGHDSLGAMRELALINLREQGMFDLLAKPPTAGPARDLDMRPGAHTHVADMSQVQAAKPIYEVNPLALQAAEKKILRLHDVIDRLTYADLFMAITNMPGVQPRNVEELLKRDEEKLTQIGPVVEMVNDDMLPVAVERMIGIARRGELIPPAPEELQGKELKVEFVSVLAMAQKMLGLSTTERVVGFVGSLGSIFGPQVLDKIDPDAIVDDYAERANMPAKAIRDSRTVNNIRQQRQQQEQMAQMAALAQPAKDATTAALNIAEMSNDTARY